MHSSGVLINKSLNRKVDDDKDEKCGEKRKILKQSIRVLNVTPAFT